MKKHIIKEEDILAEDKRFSVFENQDIINEFDSYFGWIMACSTGGFEKEDYEKLKDFLQKAISQTEKEAYEKCRLETIKEIEGIIVDHIDYLRDNYGDIMDIELLEHNVLKKVQSILNQLKDNGKY
jgi:hypothetical protein